MSPATLKQNAIASHDAADTAITSFANAKKASEPFGHWLFQNALTNEACTRLLALPIAVVYTAETHGKRDSHNDLRRFFSPAMQATHEIMSEVAQTFQSEPVVRSIEKLCGIKLSGSYLRIEYCQDVEGFWLEPHMDIKEKHITMQIYLNTASDAATLGTDMYDKNKKHHSRAPGDLNQGMIFIPAEPNSWHGFEKRPIKEVRRSLIINYVTSDWRARHELAFPDQSVS